MNPRSTFLSAKQQQQLAIVPTVQGFEQYEDEVVAFLLEGYFSLERIPVPEVEAYIRAAFRGGLIARKNKPQ